MKTVQRDNHGFTLVELLITISIIGILATMVIVVAIPARNKAIDARIRNDIAQLRWEAEIVYDTQGASYQDWTEHTTVTNNVNIIMADIDSALGQVGAATIRDSAVQSYCASAPLKSVADLHYCIDDSGAFREVDQPCSSSTPFECPSS